MNCFEKGYCTVKNQREKYISPEKSRIVTGKLRRYNGKGSVPTSNGRAYLVKGGEIEHSMGPQPELVIKSPTREGLERIVKRFGL